MDQSTQFGTGTLGGPAMWWGTGRVELSESVNDDTDAPELQLYIATELERLDLYLSAPRLDWLIDALVAMRSKLF